MKNVITCCIAFFFYAAADAQVQVSKEPRHRAVIQNKYVRVLDVNMPPGDTTQFHVHSTPSLFVWLSNTSLTTQIKGQQWVTDKAEAGKAWYKAFSPDSLVHRVVNADSVPLHVADIELLSPYTDGSNLAAQPFTVLFENEKAFAYKLTAEDIRGELVKERGPMIAFLIKGESITVYDVPSNGRQVLKVGEFIYINPGSYCSFTAAGSGSLEMVLFEIK